LKIIKEFVYGCQRNSKTIIIVDIQNENVINSLDWKLLQELADELKLTMISSVSYNSFYSNYKEYVRRFCPETIDT
jgi:NADH:ubiquinone oxidoreductase subunit E